MGPLSFVIRPDDHAVGTALTNIIPQVTLTTAGADNVSVPLFTITAADDDQDLAPTPTRVFAHSDIPFFNHDRRLRMDFTTPVRHVSIFFAGGTFFQTEIGRLRVYDASDNLIGEYVTSPRGAGEIEEMTITHAAADIAWAVAFIADNEGEFGRLDDLSFGN
jgi:hypothetical protein